MKFIIFVIKKPYSQHRRWPNDKIYISISCFIVNLLKHKICKTLAIWLNATSPTKLRKQ